MPNPPREPIWTRPARGTRGPQPEHSREAIARCATALADAGGLSAVTMRAVADSLGLRAASLYRYVDSRAEVLDLMADSALGEFQLPELDEGPWVDQLLAIAHEQRRVYLRHPWLLEATRSTGSFGPNALRFFDVCLAILTPVEVPTSRKMEALAMMTGVVTLFAAPPPPEDVDPTRLFAAVVADPESFPHLCRALADPASGGQAPEDLFDRTVLALLTGLLS